MKKQLYFVCPTDCLETIIDEAFGQEHYFCSSLGNTISFDQEVVGQTIKLIETKEIQEISFVLSSDNRIVLDAIQNQDFSAVRGLEKAYEKLKIQKKHSEMFWQRGDSPYLLLSYHLNNKIKELQKGLNYLLVDPIQVNGKIYHRKKNKFYNIYSDLICVESSAMN